MASSLHSGLHFPAPFMSHVILDATVNVSVAVVYDPGMSHLESVGGRIWNSKLL